MRNEKDSNYINLMKVEFLLCNHYKEDFDGLRLNYCSKSLKVVNVFTLLKPCYNSLSLVSFNIANKILFSYENPLCCQNMLIC